MPSNTTHRFIISTDSHQQSARERELQLSDIRSHARQVSYLKWRNGAASDWRARLQQSKRSATTIPQSPASSPGEVSRPPSHHSTPRESSDSPDSQVQIDEHDVLSEAEAEAFLKDVWMPNPAPTWSKGDPFDCIPGSNEVSARIGLDFCKLACSDCSEGG